MGTYASVAVRDSYGNIVGYASTSTGQMVESTSIGGAYYAERAKVEQAGSYTSQERYYDTSTAAGIAAQVNAQGGTVQAGVGARAVGQGMSPESVFVTGAQGQPIKFAEATQQNINVGRSIVPIREITPAASGLGQPISRGGTTTTVYAPVSEYQTIAVRNANIVADYNTGEFGIYQRIYDPKTGKERMITNLVGGGGRAALQSGMFSYQESNAPAEMTYEQYESGNIQPVSMEYARTRSRLGAEAYGGYSGVPLDERTIGSTGAQLSTYANPYNLAGLVNPQGANLSKTQAPGINLAWTQSRDLAAITVLNYREQGRVLEINTGAVIQPAIASPLQSPLPASPVASGAEVGLPRPFVSAAGTTAAPSEKWYAGIPVIGGIIPSGIFRETSQITEPSYKGFATSIAPVVMTTIGPETMVPMSDIAARSPGPEYSYKYISEEGIATPIMAKVSMTSTTIAPSPAAASVSGFIAPITKGYDKLKLGIQERLPAASYIEPFVKQAQLSNPVTAPFVAASMAAPAIANVIPGAPGWYKQQVSASAKAGYEMAPGSLAGQYTQFREEPLMVPASYAIGVGLGGVTRGVSEVYPRVKAVFETGKRSKAIFSTAEKFVPGGLAAIYGADIAYRSTQGFTATEGALVRSRGIIAQEAAPVLGGGYLGYRAPELASSAVRKIPSVAQVKGAVQDFAWRQQYDVTRIPRSPTGPVGSGPVSGQPAFTERNLLGSAVEPTSRVTDIPVYDSWVQRGYNPMDYIRTATRPIETIEPAITHGGFTPITKPQVTMESVNRGVVLYGREFYKPINAFLRGNESRYFKTTGDTYKVMGSKITLTETQDAAYSLVHGVETFGRAFPEDITVYRGLKSGSKSAASLLSKGPGDVYSDIGLQSFTNRPSVASVFAGDSDYGVILKYNIPSGSRVYTPNEAAHELTLPPGEFTISKVYDVPRRDIAKAIYEDQNENAITRVIELSEFNRIIPDSVSGGRFEPGTKPERQIPYNPMDYIRTGPKLLAQLKPMVYGQKVVIREGRVSSYSFQNEQITISENRRFTGDVTRDIQSSVTYSAAKLSEPIADITAWSTQRNVAVTARTGQTTTLDPFTGKFSSYVQKSYELSPKPKQIPSEYRGEEFGYELNIYDLPVRIERIGTGTAAPSPQFSAMKSVRFAEARPSGTLDIEAKRFMDLSYGEAETGFTFKEGKLGVGYQIESVKTREIGRVFEDIITSEKPVELSLAYQEGVPRPNIIRAAEKRVAEEGGIKPFSGRVKTFKVNPKGKITESRPEEGSGAYQPPISIAREMTAPKLSPVGKIQESIQRAIIDVAPKRTAPRESMESKMQKAVVFRKQTEARNAERFAAYTKQQEGEMVEFAKPTMISSLLYRQTPESRAAAMAAASEFRQKTVSENKLRFEMEAQQPRKQPEPEPVADTTGLYEYSNAMMGVYRGNAAIQAKRTEAGVFPIRLGRPAETLGIDARGSVVSERQMSTARPELTRDMIIGKVFIPTEMRGPISTRATRRETRIGFVPTQETPVAQTLGKIQTQLPGTITPGGPTPTPTPPVREPPVSKPPFVPDLPTIIGSGSGASYGSPRTRSWTETNPVGADILGAKRAMTFEAPTAKQFRPRMKKFKMPKF